MEEKEGFLMRFLYRTVPGRMLLKRLVRPAFSEKAARFLSSELSRPLIRPYIRRNHIPMEGYENEDWRSFNDFFIRRRTSEALDVDRTASHLISPCDGLLTAYPITADSRFRVKGSDYTLFDLLGDRFLANQYRGGWCLIFRLTPRHYHRYCYIDDGTKGDNYPIPGQLHSVRPICCECVPVYVRNSREYTVLNTEHFGPVVQIEVGALLVGKICNEQQRGKIFRGEEKGHFEFGGSTILLLLRQGAAQPEEEILRHTALGREWPVRLGQKIGVAGETP